MRKVVLKELEGVEIITPYGGIKISVIPKTQDGADNVVNLSVGFDRLSIMPVSTSSAHLSIGITDVLAKRHRDEEIALDGENRKK